MYVRWNSDLMVERDIRREDLGYKPGKCVLGASRVHNQYQLVNFYLTERLNS